MLNKLEGIYQRYIEVSKMMTDTEIISDQEKMTKLYKESKPQQKYFQNF